MKKVLLSVFCLMMFVGVSQAQEFKPFKLGFGLGYAKPAGGGGILVDLEPAYRINDAIAVGLRLESAVMARLSADGTSGSASANGSYTLNGQYYFSNSSVRPYAGLGLGIFTIASGSVSETSGAVAAGSKIGFYPRLGLDMGHFNINLDYNLIPASDALTLDGSTMTTTKIKNSYIGFRVGFFVFGGRK